MYRQVDGDVDVIARVTAVENTDAWTKAGVMIRDALTSNAAHVSMFVTAVRTASHSSAARLPVGRAMHTDAGAVRAPYWVKLERRGTKSLRSSRTDGTAWVQVGTATLALPTVYVGLAVTSHNTSVRPPPCSTMWLCEAGRNQPAANGLADRARQPGDPSRRRPR